MFMKLVSFRPKFIVSNIFDIMIFQSKDYFISKSRDLDNIIIRYMAIKAVPKHNL